MIARKESFAGFLFSYRKSLIHKSYKCKLYDNQFEFAPENAEAVKRSICLYDSGETALYGKTGTEEMNGQNASGPIAAELTFEILTDLHL